MLKRHFFRITAATPSLRRKGKTMGIGKKLAVKSFRNAQIEQSNRETMFETTQFGPYIIVMWKWNGKYA